MTFYRLALLDPQGIVASSFTTDKLADIARLMLEHADSIGEPATEQLLDADGELTFRVTTAGDRELTLEQKTNLTALLEEYGATQLNRDDDGGLWGVDGTEYTR